MKDEDPDQIFASAILEYLMSRVRTSGKHGLGGSLTGAGVGITISGTVMTSTEEFY